MAHVYTYIHKIHYIFYTTNLHKWIRTNEDGMLTKISERL